MTRKIRFGVFNDIIRYPSLFFKGLLNIPVSHEGCTREFRFWVAKEQARQLCSHNSHARVFPQLSQRSCSPRPSQAHLHGSAS